MLLIEKKVIEKIKRYCEINSHSFSSDFEKEKLIKYISALFLEPQLLTSKEVEVVDIFNDIHDTVIAPNVKHLLTNLGYQLIKIKGK